MIFIMNNRDKITYRTQSALSSSSPCFPLSELTHNISWEVTMHDIKRNHNKNHVHYHHDHHYRQHYYYNVIIINHQYYKIE